MKCPNCGGPPHRRDDFCKHCRKALKKQGRVSGSGVGFFRTIVRGRIGDLFADPGAFGLPAFGNGVYQVTGWYSGDGRWKLPDTGEGEGRE